MKYILPTAISPHGARENEFPDSIRAPNTLFSGVAMQ
jgi:hypothetical protein